MMNLMLLCHGNLKERYLREGCDEYRKRLSAFCTLTVYEAKDNAALLCKIPRKGYKIALCVEGKPLSSEELAETVEALAVEGVSDLTFLIGGSDGLPEEAKAQCDFRLSFSKMTFPHQLMRLILLEQLYRAFTIIRGVPYHK